MSESENIPIDTDAVRALVLDHAPQWADLPVIRLPSSGTDNALYRLGEDLVLRLPRRVSAIPLLRKELDWLPHLSGLPLDIPALELRGRVRFDHEFDFAVFRWLHGQIAKPENIADPVAAAKTLASFLKALHKKKTDGAPLAGANNNRRGVALELLSDDTLSSIDILADEIDVRLARSMWQAACSAECPEVTVWLHGDLKADNLIANNGKLCGVIDWGLSAVGDPAADYATAWSWVEPSARNTFREAMGLGDSDWLRSKGWALYGAVIALSCYRGGLNKPLCRQCRLTLSRLGLLL